MDGIIYGQNWYIEEIDQAHRIAECALPNLAMGMENYVTGGGFFAFENPMEIEPLRFELAMHGSHEALRSRFGREAGDWTTFATYERSRDIDRGLNKGRIVSMTGLINGITSPRIVGKRAGQTRYSGGSVWTYLDMVDGRVVHRFDFKRNLLVIDGVPYTDEANRLLART